MTPQSKPFKLTPLCAYICVCVCSEDKGSFNTLVDAVKTNYNERFEEIRKRWGGGVMGVKTQAAKAKLDRVKLKELAQKM